MKLRWAGIGVVAILLRVINITPSFPYIAYIDEGHVLHPVMHLLRERTWDPGSYGYPPATFYILAVAEQIASPVAKAITGHSLVNEMPVPGFSGVPDRIYDLVGPPLLLIVARLVMLLFGVGTVLFTALLARTLFGSAVAECAALVAAVCPAFVFRGSFVMVDTATTFWVSVALFLSARIFLVDRAEPDRTSSRSGASLFLVALSGFVSALSVASKYSAAVIVPLAASATILGAATMTKKLRRSAAFVSGAAIGVLAGAPTFVFRFIPVKHALEEQTNFYKSLTAGKTYLWQSLQSYELGIPMLLCALGGMALLLLSHRHRLPAAAWLAFATLWTLPLLRFPFQPLRNLVPLFPVLCIAAAYFIVKAFEWRSNGGGALAGSALGLVSITLLLISFVKGFLLIESSQVWKDSRVEAVDWLARHARGWDKVLIRPELALLPSEIGRIPARTKQALCAEMASVSVMPSKGILYFVVNREAPGSLAGCRELASLDTVATFGSESTPPFPDYWRGNREAVLILMKRSR